MLTAVLSPVYIWAAYSGVGANWDTTVHAS